MGGGGGVLEAKILEAKYEAKLEFPWNYVQLWYTNHIFIGIKTPDLKFKTSLTGQCLNILFTSNIATEDMLYTESDLEKSMDKIEMIHFHQVSSVAALVGKHFSYS